MDHSNTEEGARRRWNPVLRTIWWVFVFILPLVILGAGIFAARHLLQSGPTAQRRKPERRARLVEVVQAKRESVVPSILAMGTVRASRELRLRARVSGEVVEMSPRIVPGARLEAGEVVLRIDPTDYELSVRRREAVLAKAKADLQIEQGNQLIARREAELLGGEVTEGDRSLLLRAPQLETVRSVVRSAEADLEEARLDLSRTTIRAPFNAVVRERLVELGTQVGITTELVSLVGNDEYWVEVSVSVGMLRWIRMPSRVGEPGSEVRILDEAAWGSGVHRTGRLTSLTSDLEPQGRMARLLVSVADPLGVKGDLPSMLIGSYVRVEIAGRPLEGVVAVDQQVLREGDRVWVMNEKDELEIRAVEIAFREQDRVCISKGIADGERLVVTDLSSPVEGMSLRLPGGDVPAGKSPR